MTTVRSAKNKGSQMEYSCRDSLLPEFPDILLTKQLGFVSQYDLVSHERKIVFECKKHKGFSWNELKKYFLKLKSKAPINYAPILLFQANNQPCLVFYQTMDQYKKTMIYYAIQEFESYFGTPFIRHKGSRKNGNKDADTGTIQPVNQ